MPARTATPFCRPRLVSGAGGQLFCRLSWNNPSPCSVKVFTPDGSIVDGEIVDHKNGTYEFVYVIPKEGDFSLALRLYDQHIKGSPFKLSVSRISEVEVRRTN